MSYVNAPIHDLLIRIKNSYMARKKILTGIVYSQYKENVLLLLKKYRFIESYKVISIDAKKYLDVQLHFSGNLKEDIPVVKFFSTPSRKRYLSRKDLKSVASGKGIGIISTSKGLMAVHEAKLQKIGGELIAEIY